MRLAETEMWSAYHVRNDRTLPLHNVTDQELSFLGGPKIIGALRPKETVRGHRSKGPREFHVDPVWAFEAYRVTGVRGEVVSNKVSASLFNFSREKWKVLTHVKATHFQSELVLAC